MNLSLIGLDLNALQLKDNEFPWNSIWLIFQIHQAFEIQGLNLNNGFIQLIFGTRYGCGLFYKVGLDSIIVTVKIFVENRQNLKNV